MKCCKSLPAGLLSSFPIFLFVVETSNLTLSVKMMMLARNRDGGTGKAPRHVPNLKSEVYLIVFWRKFAF